jgi:hypothetical protein
MSPRSLRSIFTGRRAVVNDPTEKLQEEVVANPEDDNLEERLITRERHDIERPDDGFTND